MAVTCRLLNGDIVPGIPKSCATTGNIRVEVAKWFQCVVADIILLTTTGDIIRDPDIPPEVVVTVKQSPKYYDADTWRRIILLHAQYADAEGITRAVRRMASDGVAIQGSCRPFMFFPLDPSGAGSSTSACGKWWDNRKERSHAILLDAWFECPADVGALQSLVSAGVSVDAGGLRCRTALHVAAHRGDLPKVQSLITIKAQFGADSCGISPLHDAVIEAHTEVVELLLDSGSLVNDASEAGFMNTPLHWACRAGNTAEHTKVVQLLIERRCDISARNADGKTALHDAISGRRVSLVVLLLEHSADVNAQTSSGNTPLHFVQWSPMDLQGAMTEVLVKYGANVAIKNNRGEAMFSTLSSI